MARFARLLVICLLMAVALSMHATSFIGGTNNTSLGPTQTYGNIVVDAMYFDGSSWQTGANFANLWNRVGSNDNGLGVCDKAELNCNTGGGDVNEISGGKNEAIRLTLPTGYIWTSVGVSSLDKNGSTDPSKWERGQLYGSSQNTLDGTAVLLCNFVTGGAANNSCSIGGGLGAFEPDLTLTGGNSSKYLFFVAYDFTGSGNQNNDYLVRAANVQAVPEPASLLLLGSGIAGLATKWRRRR